MVQGIRGPSIDPGRKVPLSHLEPHFAIQEWPFSLQKEPLRAEYKAAQGVSMLNAAASSEAEPEPEAEHA